MPIIQPPAVITERAYVTQGLEDQDDSFDLLEELYTEMQRVTVETQSVDLLSFATGSYFFGVIMLETTTTPVAEEYVSDEDKDDRDDALPPRLQIGKGKARDADDTSRGTSPIESPIWSPESPLQSPAERLQMLREAASTTPTRTLFPTLSEDDKVLLWREALMEKLEKDAEAPLVPKHQEPGIRPIFSPVGNTPEYHLDPPFENANDAGANFINWPDDEATLQHQKLHHSVPQDDGDRTPEPDLYMVTYAPSDEKDKPVGREFLHTDEEDANPPQPLVDIQQDAAMEEFVFESAVKHQKALREKRIKEFLAAQRRQERVKEKFRPATPPPPTSERVPIGLIYLSASQHFADPLHIGECNLGMYIAPEHQAKGCLLNPVDSVVRRAFQDPECHRLQAIIVENPNKLYTLELLARAGFRNEGMRRRAFFSHSACEWRDVTYFAMLATEWVYDTNNDNSIARLRTKSLWDEVFARHQKECDDLLRLEEKSTLKRTGSVETIRHLATSAYSVSGSERGDGNTDAGSSIRSSAKRRRIDGAQPRSRGPPFTFSSGASSSGLESEWEVASSVSAMSIASVPESVATSIPDGRSVASGNSSSEWDLV